MNRLQGYIENASRVLPVEEDQLRKILAGIIGALEGIHALGVVHLDLKPENIFIKGDLLKIGDFGQACWEGVSSSRDGDRTYMAPELLNASTIKSSADIFR